MKHVKVSQTLSLMMTMKTTVQYLKKKQLVIISDNVNP